MNVEIDPMTQNQSRARILLGPGPSMVHPRVYQAMAQPIYGHLDPEFLKLMDGIQDRLRQVFRTENPLTLSVSGTGSSGMEASLVNLIEPGDGVLVCVNGIFGARMCDIVERLDGSLTRIDRPWGEVFDPEEISSVLASEPDIEVVAIVHAETSTGAHQPLEEIGIICRQMDRLLVVDAVTSLAGTELEVDDWMIDVCYSGTQKCLSCPPGLAPLTLGSRALDRMRQRKSKPRSWYLDLGMIERYWLERSRAYHHTAPITMNYALSESLNLVLEEGLENRFDRHRLHSRALMAGLGTLGFEPFAQEGHRLPMLNAVYLPAGLDDLQARTRLRDEFNIEVGGGLGELAGRIWRIGLMGESARSETVLSLLTAIEEIAASSDRSPVRGGATQAAQAIYADSR
jgi:alanine-glyoxylate transaminase/serine-glyoxylate transaminase/serine-pyruvate transaminase